MYSRAFNVFAYRITLLAPLNHTVEIAAAAYGSCVLIFQNIGSPDGGGGVGACMRRIVYVRPYTISVYTVIWREGKRADYYPVRTVSVTWGAESNSFAEDNWSINFHSFSPGVVARSSGTIGLSHPPIATTRRLRSSRRGDRPTRRRRRGITRTRRAERLETCKREMEGGGGGKTLSPETHRPVYTYNIYIYTS